MAIIISLEVVLDIRVPLTEEAAVRAAVDPIARPEAGVEGKVVGVDVSAPLDFLRIFCRQPLLTKTRLWNLSLVRS